MISSVAERKKKIRVDLSKIDDVRDPRLPLPKWDGGAGTARYRFKTSITRERVVLFPTYRPLAHVSRQIRQPLLMISCHGAMGSSEVSSICDPTT